MNINQILNSALLTEAKNPQNEAGDKPTLYPGWEPGQNALPMSKKDMENFVQKRANEVDEKTDANQTLLTTGEIYNKKYPNALKYGGAAAIGLGAGIGAMALAKKLRAKKAAAKAKKTEKA